MAKENTAIYAKKKRTLPERILNEIKRNWILYLMILPVVVYYVIFAYWPMYGIQIAFKDYIPKLGFLNSPFVGFDHFQRFFSSFNFTQLLSNTIVISLYGLLVGFPIPIVFALLLNYIKNNAFRKTIQMVSYAPYFISTVVICGMITIFLQPDTGIFNVIRGLFGAESVSFLSKPELFKSIYVWSGVWQGIGWSSIIYISALSGVDSQQHEAAVIDGATKLQRMWHVDLPAIMPTIIMLLILNMGQIMNVGFEKIFLLQNPLNTSASDVISTYVYRVGMLNADYGYSTAVSLFNSAINVILLVTVNSISKKVSSTSLW